MAGDERRLGFTRARDLLLVAGIALIVGYVLVRWNYGRLPVLPRLAGISAAVLGIGELLAGFNIRARLKIGRPDAGSAVRSAGNLRPLPPLVGARALLVAKASSLAGAGLAGLWAGLLLYVAPRSGDLVAAGRDTVTGILGLVAAAVLVGGALWLERCCVAPDDSDEPPGLR